MVLLDQMTFPADPELTYYSGPMTFEFDVTTNSPVFNLKHITDIYNNSGCVSVVDEYNIIISIPLELLTLVKKSPIDSIYKVRACTDSSNFHSGQLRLAATLRQSFGEPVFIRHLYKLV